MSILDRIVRDKKEELAQSKRRRPLTEIKNRLERLNTSPRDFMGALRQEGLQIIAEVKPASPSRGILRQPCDPGKIAAIYTANGAAAISALTEKKYFGASLENLELIRQKTALPILRKDFIIDPYQIYEARAAGADALLLIAACLSKTQLSELYGLATESGLAVLTEVHDYRELDRVLLILDPPLIGINNRDLKTLETRLETTLSMLADIPADKATVSESGIKTGQDTRLLERAGVSAVLVGETLMTSPDIGAKLKELLPRKRP